MRRARGILIYIASVAAFVWIALELGLRAVFPDPDYHFDFRFAFISRNPYQDPTSDISTYRPNSVIRDVGVYAMAGLFPPGPRIAVEYDCPLKSNNWGLLQDRDISPGDEATLIIGDSFTAGQGGCPWFPRLQARHPNERMVNAGLIGTGFVHWHRIIEHLQQKGLVIRRILVIAISDDFRRARGTRGVDDCLSGGVCGPRNYWHTVGDAETHAELIERTAARLAARFPDLQAADYVWLWFKQNSHAIKFLTHAKKTIEVMVGAAPVATIIHPDTATALDYMKSLGVPLHVMLVPERVEAGALGALALTKLGKKLLDEHGIQHSWCDLSGGDFLPNDGHPNRAGYDKLLACADQRLTIF